MDKSDLSEFWNTSAGHQNVKLTLIFCVGRHLRFFITVRAMETKKETSQIKLSPQEQKIIEMVRNLDYGELRIIVNGKTPVRVEEIKKSIQL